MKKLERGIDTILIYDYNYNFYNLFIIEKFMNIFLVRSSITGQYVSKNQNRQLDFYFCQLNLPILFESILFDKNKTIFQTLSTLQIIITKLFWNQ